MRGIATPLDPAVPEGILVLVHGYLDGPDVWARVVERLELPGWSILCVAWGEDQPPESTSELQLEQYASAVLAEVHLACISGSATVVVVGHSMGGQIGELVARRLGSRAAGLALVTSAPLGGYALPPPVMERFMSRAGMKDKDAIREGKRSLAMALDEEGLDILVRCTVATSHDQALAQLRAWTGGHPAGGSPSSVDQPVLCIATDDTFFSEELVGATAARFPNGTTARVPGAGHWPQLEQPEALAQTLTNFIRTLPGQTANQP
ncbi:alpha/beta hydrolase [Cupriavidus basilensis OR16]|uniref:Alpha/beta hydrolase n=1 Tax=Cupriavidus basilensis OR16 TaxID=1127483 RepID=H1S900_9BURK|nr:alpha/beta hydrolase [Cupriavidus basilensis OR16]